MAEESSLRKALALDFVIDAEFVVDLKDLKLSRKPNQIKMLTQPRYVDAVLGGNKPPPTNAAVLGGIEGVKLRLSNSDDRVRMEALNEALNYEEAGIDLLIKTGIKDESCIVWYRAFKLLAAIEPKSDKLVEALNKIAIRFFE